MQELMGEAYNPAMLDEDILKTAALQQLINEELLLQAADTEGFAASNQLCGKNQRDRRVQAGWCFLQGEIQPGAESARDVTRGI